MNNQKSSVELKDQAKELLLGRYGLPMGALVIYGLISAITAALLNYAFPGYTYSQILLYYAAALILQLLLSLPGAGISKLLLNLSRREEARLSDLFYCFSRQPDRVILLTLATSLMGLACLTPALLLWIAGMAADSFLLLVLSIFAGLIGLVAAVVLLLSYSMVYYIYLDDPQKGVFQILRESRAMMAGNRGRYFYLQISFIGLSLLCVLSCFIGFLWLTPYMECTNALFYQNVKGEL